jgi:hypothetical protein
MFFPRVERLTRYKVGCGRGCTLGPWRARDEREDSTYALALVHLYFSNTNSKAEKNSPVINRPVFYHPHLSHWKIKAPDSNPWREHLVDQHT